MKVKKFIANDFQSAIQQAKSEMGKNAIILNTRQVNGKGLFSFFRKSQVEITVALDEELKLDRDKLYMQGSQPARKDSNLSVNKPFLEPSLQVENEELFWEISKMKDLMADIKNKVYEMEKIRGFSPSVDYYYQVLIKNQVNIDLATQIASKIERRLVNEQNDNPEWVKKLYRLTLEDYLPNVKPIAFDKKDRAHVVVFVGPTGVGKTTTIAKLAAQMIFIERKKAAFITLDTYRISAAEQLRTFAEIIEVPVKVVFTPHDLKDAIRQYAQKDIIFIDTAGRSPFNKEQMQELKEFVTIAQPDETLLVLSLTMTSDNMINNYQQFNEVGIDKFVITKIDETQKYGNLLNLIAENKKPVAYFTNGQNVPDDILIPNINSFVEELLEDEPHA